MFAGVFFVLFGFDPVLEAKVRSKLVNGGGVDVGQYGPSSTHVIVDKIVYDDPVCVAARNDRKILVTGLWVDHSFDIGMPVDASSILYRPVKDLNGIPGAKTLSICLTGYQRQDREDIMEMVGLMGAHFSKPLVANKITHLICYKFEGEKYELAKKMKKIKLVNHRWLEDCLKAWEILPEDNYNKSGYELEIMEAEAKDSEEETEEDTLTKQNGERNTTGVPFDLQNGISRGSELPMAIGEVSKIEKSTTGHNDLSKTAEDVVNNDRLLTTCVKEIRSDKVPVLYDLNGKGLEEVNYQGARSYHGNAFSGGLSIPYDKTPSISNEGNALIPNFGTAKRSPHSDEAKLNSLSYSRKTPKRSPVSMFSDRLSSHVRGSPQGGLEECKGRDEFDFSALTLEKPHDNMDLRKTQFPKKGEESHHEEGQMVALPQKRRMAFTSSSSKSQKGNHDSIACASGSPSASTRTEGLESTFLMVVSPKMKTSPSLRNNVHTMDRIGTVNSIENQHAMLSTTKSVSCNKKSKKCGLPVSKTWTPENIGSPLDIKITDFTKEKTPETSLGVLKLPNLASVSNISEVGISRTDLMSGQMVEQEKQILDCGFSSPNTKKVDIEKSPRPANLDTHKGRNDEGSLRSLSKKTVARKSLGSKPKLSTGNSNKRKGFSYVDKTITPNETVLCSAKGTEGAVLEKKVSAEKRELITSAHAVKDEETKGILCSNNKIEAEAICMDDETEPPEDKDGAELEKALNEEKSEMINPISGADIVVKQKLKGVNASTNKTKTILCMDGDTLTSGEEKVEADVQIAINAKKTGMGELSFVLDAVKEEVAKEGKRPSSKTNKKAVSAMNEVEMSEKGKDQEELENKSSDGKAEMEKAKGVQHPATKTKGKTVAANKTEKAMDAEKENKPIENRGQSKHGRTKVAVKSDRVPMKSNQMVCGTNSNAMQGGGGSIIVRTEPVWFILSGHHLQRKEFQQVIRRLKGRYCRDSHHWSYQATHFIVPDPVRRTEKFFAAAASGRWILKMDYLTASNQAGKFLAEEPYEWYKKGLSEDGAINLEAPRKWRLLRERTGHGAFYGMRIIIYGESIAPPLDTLKRVVKAGDGIILATSPPYTRFLKSGVDFAIVSPGMPRVDSWVQEFVRHEIPCVVADYLVEYVCKPGYSLERHVLYKTHAWAEKSFADLSSRLEEIIEVSTPSENDDSEDLTCQVCGSRDRGEVMLICGDESGSKGCGVGIHIDCCDPPLEDVPNEDWFCTKCSESRNSTKPRKRTKKRSS